MSEPKRSKMPAIISVIITVGYFSILIGMMTGGLVLADSQALLLMLGGLSTGFGIVTSYWFGSTSGSQSKNDLLAKATFEKKENNDTLP
jgi:hypothetical protein